MRRALTRQTTQRVGFDGPSDSDTPELILANSLLLPTSSTYRMSGLDRVVNCEMKL